ncbi:MAG TPA: NfeD family protein [Actinomycetaceae bacterium]|nr:NfeD family protein [Actinomycetaceae bacterium]
MAWLLWLLAAIVAGIVEMFTLDLIFLMLAGGALGAMVAALAGGEFWVQVLAFALVSTLLLFLARPAAKAWMDRHSPESRTNVDRYKGETAEVLAEVTRRGGRVKLEGEVWSARSARPDEVFQEGQIVLVVDIDGAFAVVSRMDWPASPGHLPPTHQPPAAY